jgi:ATP-dependent Clp protease ATP-binding subunit ClpA
MFEKYTERARRVIFFARYEASQFGSSYIETEHLLLGILREDKALTNRFLRSHASVEWIRKQIEGIPPSAKPNHEFEKARYYSEEERKLREKLGALRENLPVEEKRSYRAGQPTRIVRKERFELHAYSRSA